MKCLLLAALLTLSVSGNAWGGEEFPETVEDYISACNGPPPKKWSTVIVSKRRIRNGEQTSQTRRNSDEVAAG